MLSKEEIQTVLTSQEKSIRLKRDDCELLLCKNDNGWIQRIPNKYYGYAITDKGSIIPSYPHLNNINEERFSLDDSYAEEKLNGTCVGIAKIDGQIIIRTRMSPYAKDFVVTVFSNQFFDEVKDQMLLNKFKSLKEEMLTKHPNWYVNGADGTYVGLKVREVVQDILGSKINFLVESYPDYMFFFELIGKINPILVEGESKYGMYNHDASLVLFDILDMTTGLFKDRETKEIIADTIDLELVPKLFSFKSTDDTKKAIEILRKYADDYLIEGFVLKSSERRVKVKTEKVLSAAIRSFAIAKEQIAFGDLENYIAKIVSVDYLKHPEKFDVLIEQVVDEAKTDYPESIINAKKGLVQEKISKQMAIFVADDIMKTMTFSDKGELFRYINLNLPILFSPLRTYVDFEVEKTTDDVLVRNKMKKRRCDIMKTVSKYILHKKR